MQQEFNTWPFMSTRKQWLCIYIVGGLGEVLASHDQFTAHHEEAHSLPVKFLKDVKSLTPVLRERWSSFLDGAVTSRSPWAHRDVIEQEVALA